MKVGTSIALYKRVKGDDKGEGIGRNAAGKCASLNAGSNKGESASLKRPGDGMVGMAGITVWLVLKGKEGMAMRGAVARVIVNSGERKVVNAGDACRMYNVAGRAAGDYDADAEYARIEAEYNTIGPNREWLERSAEMEREILDARMGARFDQN
ncbi:MAG: hypothetical protein HPY71_06080 [Firmicutes bacterium]|nr:hypothetical protein [Bacillota bacterium]